MSATTHSPLDALAVGNAKRLEVAELRRRVRAGDITLLELLEDPPAAMAHVTLFDCALWVNRTQRRSGARTERLGRMALVEGVNLGMPVGRASARSRRFVGVHAGWHGGAKGRVAA